jgi:predicted O-methyltransferase YrrM
MTEKIRFIIKYLKYRILSKTKFGIHSPFLYDLITNVFYDKTKYDEFIVLNELRNKLAKDERLIDVKDLGAGSRVNNSQKRSISEICKNSTMPKKYAQLLFRLVKNHKPENILELGTSLGITTSYLAFASPNSKIFTIEGSEEIYNKANENFENLKLRNIHSICGSFNDNLNSVLESIDKLDFVLFDGDHKYDSTVRYFEMCLKKYNQKSIFVFDDIKWSKEMENAWDYIKKKEEVSLTIDVFKMGIVFFDKQLSKQDFIVRF